MKLYDNCKFCGKQIHGGKYKNFITCKVCKEKACRNCSKDELCLTHYNELNFDQKQKIKSNLNRFYVFGIVIPIFILIGIIIFVTLIQNGTIATPDNTIAIFTVVFLVLLVIYMILMFFMKEKNLRKILQVL